MATSAVLGQPEPIVIVPIIRIIPVAIGYLVVPVVVVVPGTAAQHTPGNPISLLILD